MTPEIELVILVGFGILGYIFRKLQFDIAPLILAMIIGPILELKFRQSLMSSGGSFSIFWKSPIAMVLIIVSFLLFVWNLYRASRPTKAAWEQVLEESEE